MRRSRSPILLLAAVMAAGCFPLHVGATPMEATDGPYLLAELPVLPEWCQVLAFWPDGRLVAANWLEAAVWETSDWSAIDHYEKAIEGWRLLAVEPHGQGLLVATTTGSLDLLDPVSFDVIARLGSLEGSDRPRAAFSADGRLLAVKNREKEVDVWDLVSGVKRYTVRGHGSEVLSLAFSADGRWLATGAGRLEGTISDSLIKVWQADSGRWATTLATLAIGNNLSLSFTPDGSLLMTAGTYGIIVYDTTTWTQVVRLSGHRTWSHDAAISPDGRRLATVNDFSELCVWNLTTWQLSTVVALPGSATQVAFSEDGSLLACAVPTSGQILVYSCPDPDVAFSKPGDGGVGFRQ